MPITCLTIPNIFAKIESFKYEQGNWENNNQIEISNVKTYLIDVINVIKNEIKDKTIFD